MEPSVAQNTFWLKLIVAFLTLAILVAFGVVVAGLMWQLDKTSAAMKDDDQPPPAIEQQEQPMQPSGPIVPDGF